MKPDNKKSPKKKYHKPRLTVYGDAVRLTDAAGNTMQADGAGGYTKTKTA